MTTRSHLASGREGKGSPLWFPWFHVIFHTSKDWDHWSNPQHAVGSEAASTTSCPWNIRPACVWEMRSRPLQLPLHQEQTSSMGSTTYWTADHLHLHRVHQCLGPSVSVPFSLHISGGCRALPCVLVPCYTFASATRFMSRVGATHFQDLTCFSLSSAGGSPLTFSRFWSQFIRHSSSGLIVCTAVGTTSRDVTLFPADQMCLDLRHALTSGTHTSHSAQRFVPLCAQLSSSSCIGSLLADGCLQPAGFRSLFFAFGCGIRRPSIVDNVIQLGFVCHVFLLCALLTPFPPCARCLSVVCAGLSTHHIHASRRRFKLCFDKKYLQTMRIDFAVFLMLMPFWLLIFQLTHLCPPSEQWIGFG